MSAPAITLELNRRKGGRGKLQKTHNEGGATPRRIKLGALARWRRRELLDWIKADCPPREK